MDKPRDNKIDENLQNFYTQIAQEIGIPTDNIPCFDLTTVDPNQMASIPEILMSLRHTPEVYFIATCGGNDIEEVSISTEFLLAGLGLSGQAIAFSKDSKYGLYKLNTNIIYQE